MSEAWKRVSGWSEGGDDVPKFGRKARGWFIRMLRAKLYEFAQCRVYSMTPSELEAVAERYASDPMPYVEWDDDEVFRGGRFSSGGWQMDWDAVRATLPAVIEGVRVSRDAVAISSLDEWLRADIAGTLKYEGAEGGTGLLPKKLCRELRAAAGSRRRKLPRICSTCRNAFEPRSNRQRRCGSCIDAGIVES